MSTKDALLEVAARLYSELGWRGTTTRRIAEAAGVNEVTVFRHFRSKEVLLGEAIRAVAQGVHPTHSLPEVPQALREELLAWAVQQHELLREHGPLIRTCLGEFTEHPELAPVACEGALVSMGEAVRYLEAARAQGMLGSRGSIEAAVVMLMNAVFMDAITRGIATGYTPATEDVVLREFVDLTLRALGAREDQ